VRLSSRIDSNQNEIVGILRQMGVSVAVTSMVGHGFPDLVAALQNVTVLIECKNGKKPLSQQKLTKDQEKFHDEWRGHIHIVRSVEDAISLVNRMRMVAAKGL
jgi:Holliday junction resolvase